MPVTLRKRNKLKKISISSSLISLLSKFLAIDTETTGLDLKHGCRAFAVSMCNQDGEQFYWEAPVDPKTRTPKWSKDQRDEIVAIIQKHKVLVFHNAVFDMQVLGYLDSRLLHLEHKHDCHDTMILCHLIDSKSTKGLKELGVLKLGIHDKDEKELDKAIKKLHFVAKRLKWDYAKEGHQHFPGAKSKFYKMDMWLPRTYALSKHFEGTEELREHYLTVCEHYARLDAVRTAGLFHYFIECLSKDPQTIPSYRLKQEAIPRLIEMEQNGISLKEEYFYNEVENLTNLKNQLLESLQYYTGYDDFNPKSTDQLRQVLFEDFKFPVIKETPAGAPSTDKEVLNELVYEANTLIKRKFLRTLLKYRACTSALQYLESYKRFQLNGVLHPKLNICGTSTTRLSSSEPNGQNVSKGKEAKDSEGNELRDADGNIIIEYSLRKVFGPPPGKVWYAIDYDQLQIRIFAYLSKEKSLIEAIEAGFDFHTSTAKELYGVQEPTKGQRKVAKYINFGIIFGAGPRKIDFMAGEEGSYAKYASRYPNVISYIDETSKEVRKNGFVRTAGGYPLTVEKYKAYAGVNYKVQGTEGEIVIKAINDIHKYFQTITTSAKFLLTVHDEIIFEVDEYEDFEQPIRQICRIMEEAGDFYGVKCKAKPEIILDNWGSPKDYWEYQESLVPF